MRTFELESGELTAAERTFEPFLTACAYAIRSTFNTTYQASPGQLVFGQDMVLPIKFKADWVAITQHKQEIINKSNCEENKKRIQHEYNVGDKVLLSKPGTLQKMSTPRKGPYTIERVFSNGTVLLDRGSFTHRVNIRRITPYFERETSAQQK